MKGQQLTTLEDWVLRYSNPYGDTLFRTECEKLAKLLKSKPKLGDFIPCDEDGNPLSDPPHYSMWCKMGKPSAGRQGFIMSNEDVAECKAYQESEKRVLWDGYWKLIESASRMHLLDLDSVHGGFYLNKVDTYSDLINIGLTFKRDI